MYNYDMCVIYQNKYTVEFAQKDNFWKLKFTVSITNIDNEHKMYGFLSPIVFNPYNMGHIAFNPKNPNPFFIG